MWLQLALLLFCCTWTVRGDGRPELETELVHQWHSLDYTWDKGHTREDYINDGRFVPENIHISSLAVHGGWIYVTVPRIKNTTGVPWVLNRVSAHGGNNQNSHTLHPWPERTGQDLGNCAHLQNPVALDIDHNSLKLYVVDNGIDLPDQNITCPPKIVVINTRSPKQQQSYPLDPLSAPNTFLASIVLDKTSHHNDAVVKFAYIAQVGANRIIVYDFAHKNSWTFSDSSMGESLFNQVTINGQTVDINYGLISLAMSPDFNYLYYISAAGHRLYQIPTWPLRTNDSNFPTPRDVGFLKSNSDAIFHGKDSLYFSVLKEDAIYKWESRKDMLEQNLHEGEVNMQTETLVALNWETMQWPDSITLDERGNLWFISNKAHLFYNGTLDFSDPADIHFRIFREPVGDYSYLHSRLPTEDPVVG